MLYSQIPKEQYSCNNRSDINYHLAELYLISLECPKSPCTKPKTTNYHLDKLNNLALMNYLDIQSETYR